MTPTIYEFRVEGRLPGHCREAFCGMHLEEVPAGLVLRGAVIDESHLLGIVSELRMLGVSLVFMGPSTRPDRTIPRRSSRLSTGSRTRRGARRLSRQAL